MNVNADSVSNGDDESTSEADELVEQFGTLLIGHAPDSGEVREFYQRHEGDPEFKALADSLIELVAKDDARPPITAVSSSASVALAAAACVPLFLLVVMTYFYANQKQQMTALTEFVQRRTSSSTSEIQSQGEQIKSLLEWTGVRDERLSASDDANRFLKEDISQLAQQIRDRDERLSASDDANRALKEDISQLAQQVNDRDRQFANLMANLQQVEHIYPITAWESDPDIFPVMSDIDLPLAIVRTPPHKPDFERGSIQFASLGSRPSTLARPPAGTYSIPPPVTDLDSDRFASMGSDREPDDEIGQRVFVYKDGEMPGDFLPTGWMPNSNSVAQNTTESDDPRSGEYFVRLQCQLSAQPWVGVYFLLNGVWEPEKPFDLFEMLDAKPGDSISCRFWARSAEQTSVQFKVGGVTRVTVRDSLVYPISTEWIRLEPEWKRYEIDLTGKKVESIVGGFVWICDRLHNGEKDVSFDLDEIYYVKTGAKPEEESPQPEPDG